MKMDYAQTLVFQQMKLKQKAQQDVTRLKL